MVAKKPATVSQIKFDSKSDNEIGFAYTGGTIKFLFPNIFYVEIFTAHPFRNTTRDIFIFNLDGCHYSF
jgi:hypothetical protein